MVFRENKEINQKSINQPKRNRENLTQVRLFLSGIKTAFYEDTV